MNLVLLGPIDRWLVVGLRDAFSDTRRAPGDIEWGWANPEVEPRPIWRDTDLWMVWAEGAHAMDWRGYLMQQQITFQMAQGQGRELIENIRFAWGRHARSRSDTRAEIRPRYISACEDCADPQCEHRLFNLGKRGL